MNYRPDIDGLRAVAVALVLLFHLDIEVFSGGYIGVDMFFVLSGYLITAIVWRQIESGQFTLLGFYSRRIVRLMPPLLATIVATTVTSAFLMDPRDFSLFAETVVAAVLSLSNVLFYSQAGYWDASGELKPLLHTWSLGIEEQFYLAWPALLLLIHRRRPTAVRPALSLITVVGAAGALLLFRVDQSAAFFLLPARIFQFSLGALAAMASAPRVSRWLPTRSTREVTQLGGIVAIVLVATLTLGPETPYPGWRSLLPTLATAAVLVGGVNGGGSFSSVLLGNRLMLWLGRLSYSLYLTHWPIIALYRYRSGLELTGPERAALLAATVVSAVILHHLVERRFYVRSGRDGATAPRPTGATSQRVPMILGTAGVIAVVLSHPALGDGWAWRQADTTLSVQAIETGRDDRFRLVRSGCNIRNLSRDVCKSNAETQVLVLGNSHEPDGYNFVVGAHRERSDVNLVSFGSTNQCDDLALDSGTWRSTAEDCQRRLDNLTQTIGDFDVVIYAANRPFAPNKDKLVGLITSLKAANPELTVVTLGGYINTEVDCARLINETGESASCVDPVNITYFEADPSGQPLFEEVIALTDRFIDRVNLLCTDRNHPSTCRSQSIDGVPMSYDRHHLSLEFALETGELFRKRHGDLFEAEQVIGRPPTTNPAAPDAQTIGR